MLNIQEGLLAFQAKDYAKAFSLLLPLAQQGDAEAQCLIANMYQLGLGVEANNLEAVNWYKKSAAQGNGVASNNLAGMLLVGYDGVASSRVEADKWFQKARSQGFVHSPIGSDYLRA